MEDVLSLAVGDELCLILSNMFVLRRRDHMDGTADNISRNA